MERIAALLGDLKIPFHFTGGIAVFYYGEPRFTQDLDVVLKLEVDAQEVSLLLDRLAQTCFIHPPSARQSIRDRTLFQAVDRATMVKVDFHVGEKIPGELDRTKACEYAPGLIVPLVSQEDAILSKLIWMKMGSHKAKADARVMWKRSEDLDVAQIRLMALQMGLASELSRIEEAAASNLNAEDLDLTS
jgi:hypothetical protein